jgi:NADH-quinone oxidoreductase subunit G
VAKITIDGKEWEFEEGMNLFEACTVARDGEKLPHFCYHPGLPIAGVCRMCQVEIEGVPKLQIACNSTVREGMVVHTRTERLASTVRQILGFHLLHHPVDCPICDQVGECALQDQYMKYGLYEADIEVGDKLAKRKVQSIGPYVMLDAERCVLCARCTRFTEHLTKTNELGIFNRGNHSEIGVAPGLTLDNDYSLNVVDLCPVGALTSRDFRFEKRVYRLKTTQSICPGCATGCNMIIGHSEGRIFRQQPRENLEVNNYWMCDSGRLHYRLVQGDDRLQEPRVKTEGEQVPVGWDHLWNEFQRRVEELGDSRRIVLVGSPHATLEELYALKSLLQDAVGGTVLGHRLMGAEMDEADEFLLSADRTPNDAGARLLGYSSFQAQDLHALASKETLLVVLENDLAGFAPAAAEALDGFGLIAYLGCRDNATSARADFVLAGQSYAEKSGTFVNRNQRAQTLQKAVDGPKQSQENWRLIARMGEMLGHAPTWRAGHDLTSELSARLPEFAAIAGGLGAHGVSLFSGETVEEVERG